MLKLCDNPPPINPEATCLAEMTGSWWVAHTKARAEKAFAWDLLRRGIGYFLPMRQKITISTGRKRKVLVPLFSSYVFFCGGEAERYFAMLTDRLCTTIHVADQQRLVRELTAIEKAVASGVTLDPCWSPTAGQRCRVTAGGLSGVEGIVIDSARPARIVLRVSMLGQAVSIEIDPDLLEPVE